MGIKTAGSEYPLFFGKALKPTVVLPLLATRKVLGLGFREPNPLRNYKTPFKPPFTGSLCIMVPVGNVVISQGAGDGGFSSDC